MITISFKDVIIISRIVDKTEIAEYFPYPPWQVFRTTGIQDGIVLKFQSHYLKIYDADSEDCYIIESYRYGCDTAIGTDKVPANRMREYASKIGVLL